MNCSEVRRLIDEMGFVENFKLEKKVLSHVEDCPDCRKYYEEHKQIARLVSNLRNQNPILKNQDKIKATILSSIENEKGRTEVKVFSLPFLTRFLAAAVIALLITLGIEQYVVLQKVQHLENQFGKIDQPTLMQEMMLYKASIVDVEALLSNGKHNISLSKLSSMFRLKRFEKSNFTYGDLKRNMDKDKRIMKLIHEQQNN